MVVLLILWLLLSCSGIADQPFNNGLRDGDVKSLVVDAGSDLLLGPDDEAELHAAVTIEPAEAPYSVSWRLLSGPGAVLFADERSLTTAAIFSTTGEYTLEVEVRAGSSTVTDVVTVFVGGGFGRVLTQYPEHSYYNDVRAFPGAEGFGANAIGGRGGRIEFITNRNDSGAGSARAAFESTGRRYIIPLVWGYVDLDSGIEVRSGHLTYAGQFMPYGQGLVFRNTRTKSWDGVIGASIYLANASNAILRYLKVYRGINSSHLESNGDAITILDSADVIIDHSAFAFGNDENVNLHGSGTKNVTVQHSWTLEPLDDSTHTKTDEIGMEHGAGMLSGYGASRVSISHMYFYLNAFRSPRLTGAGMYDVVNTYHYNNDLPLDIDQLHTSLSDQSNAIKVNVVNTLSERGPVDSEPYGMRIQQRTSNTAVPSVHLNGNIHPYRSDNSDTSLSGQWKGVNTGVYEEPIRLRERLDTPSIRTTDPFEAKEEVLSWGGPSYVWRDGELVNVRDDLLRRVVDDARRGRGPDEPRTGWGSGKDWSWPSLPSGGISENEFWQNYFNPWRDEHYPGKDWNDYVDGYQVIEYFLNGWVPDFPSMKF